MNQIIRKLASPVKLPRGVKPGLFRADAQPSMADVAASINAINTAFAAFKAKNDETLAELKRGRDDVVNREHVDRINADITRLEKGMQDLALTAAAARTAGTGGETLTPEARAHSDAFFRMIRRSHHDNGAANGLRDLSIKAALSVDSDPDGGYVVPETLETGINRVVARNNVFRTLARVVSINAPIYKRVHNLGGASSGWVGEKAARPQTNTPTLAEQTYPTMELYAMPAATQQLLDDSRVDINGWLSEEVGIQFAEQEGSALITGDGVNKPRGFLSYSFAASSAASPSAWEKIGFTKTGVNGGYAATPDGGDALIDLVYSLKAGYRAGASWLMNDASLAKTRKLKDSDGNYLWQPSLQLGEPSSLLGYACSTDDSMPDFATDAYPVAFGDYNRGYLVIDRTGTRVLVDPYSNKPYVLFYTTKRVGGGVADFQAIKVLKASA